MRLQIDSMRTNWKEFKIGLTRALAPVSEVIAGLVREYQIVTIVDQIVISFANIAIRRDWF